MIRGLKKEYNSLLPPFTTSYFIDRLQELMVAAGFEVAGNPLYHEENAAREASEFEIPGGGDELLRPEIARPS